MNSVEWVEMTPDDDGFWTAVGPFCASADVRRELGAAPRVEETDVWLVGFDDDGVVAIGCLRPGRRGALLCHSYVVPRRRGEGIYSYMVGRREGLCAGLGLHCIHVVASPMTVGHLSRAGYEPRGKRGRYTLMMKGALHVQDQ